MPDFSITVRKASPTDVTAIFQLIQELADFEKALYEVETSPEQLLKDGFTENPLYGCFVAEVEGKLVGMSLYYFRYSTWKGKRLYLEDIIVSATYRGSGIGKRLFEAALRESLNTRCNGMMWQVLDWNEGAIGFYEKYGPRFDGEWINVTLSQQQIEALINHQ
jgi:GNAT superfamily N-acetyltransferase